MKLLDLFSGIGGFSLGLDRCGFRTVAFCEVDKFCQGVLARHWPEVPRYDDIRDLTAARLAADGIAVEAICGGFPCQDISRAGSGAGIDGDRSGLWSEYCRLIGELQPGIVIVENSPELLGRGMGRVLGDLAALGYDAEWHCIPAAAVGAMHVRDRVWLVAYPGGEGLPFPKPRGWGLAFQAQGIQWGPASQCSRWSDQSGMGRVLHGVPSRVDRIRSLGNSVYPPLVERIGSAILTAMEINSGL